MKVRLGCVSNSSSSSFVLDKRRCTEEQLAAVRDHINYADDHFVGFYTSEYSAWDITEKIDELRGFTWMDNFDMKVFLDKLGIPEDAAEFDGENW